MDGGGDASSVRSDAGAPDGDATVPELCPVDPVAVPDPITVGSFCEAYQRAWCDVQTIRRGVDPETLPCDVDARELAAAMCTAERSAAVASGAVVFDARVAAACITGLVEAQCATAPLDVPECRAAFAGTLALDDACDFEAPVEVCGAGLYCQPQVDECGGRCGPYMPEGADCYVPKARCEPGLGCDWEDDYTCEVLEGELPAVSELGDPCFADEQCPQQAISPLTSGWAVHSTFCMSGFCRLGTYASGPCGDRMPCSGTQVCSSTTQVCSLAPAKSCTSYGDCERSEGDCTLIPGRCVPPFANGASCLSPDQCASGQCVLGECIVLGADGAACTTGEECISSVCRTDRCVAKFADGESCSAYTECASGRCLQGACGPRELGAPCNGDHECASRLCEESVCLARVAEGEPCGEDRFCASGHCREGFCAALELEGGICRDTGDCALELLCMSDGRCHGNGARLEEPCSDDPDSCARDLRCASDECPAFDGGRCCVPVSGQGEPCGETRDCAVDLFCCGYEEGISCSADEDMTCVPPVAVDGDCERSEHCASGRCIPHYRDEPGRCEVALDCE
jgi:hypothetical protein